MFSAVGIWLREKEQCTAPGETVSAVVDTIPTGTMLSKSTVVALYSLLVWLKFISVHSTRMKALLLCGIGLVFKLASLQ